ncbi:MAG: hypothetical protein PSN04_08945 [Methyloprofundus sp.]|nr:hypothetical protein [Methyloprofundus sp.]
METSRHGISPFSTTLSRTALKQMIHLVRDLQLLCEQPNYPSTLNNLLPVAHFNHSHYSVLMGYDFHITEDNQAKLIEVNTNAGGLWFADQSTHPGIKQFSSKLAQRLLATFLAEYRLFHKNNNATPKLLAIIDQDPEQQFLYPEMQIFAQLFKAAGIQCLIIDPRELVEKKAHLYFKGQRIDLIYNRHCDFYFSTPEMQVVHTAWKNQTTCITPNPRIYGLLADKQRMANWYQAESLEAQLPKKIASRLHKALPKTYLLNHFNSDDLWHQRKKWVFKPLNSYASRGVYIGAKLTKSKFTSFNAQETLVQEHIKPSITLNPDAEKFKTDFRLFTYRNEILALSARIYQGQVTNLRTQNGGFSRVTLL